MAMKQNYEMTMMVSLIFIRNSNGVIIGTGALRFDELLMAFSMSMRGTGVLNIGLDIRAKTLFFAAEEKLKWAFKLYDVDCSGTIDREEMILIFEKLCRFSFTR